MKNLRKKTGKNLPDAETKLTLLYLGIAVVLIGGVMAIMIYGPPDERLLRAIPACNREMASQAVEKGADVNVTSNPDELVMGAPVLFLAAQQGCGDIVDLLLAHEVNLNAVVTGTLYHGWTALMAAADRGDTSLVRRLLTHGAETAITIPKGDKQGWTAIKLAESNGYPELVRILQEAETKK